MSAQAQPQALEAEEHTLGSMLLSPNAIPIVAEILDAGDYFRASHGLIHQAILDLWVSGKPSDAVSVIAELEQRGQIGEAGGKVRVYEIARLVPTSANVRHYAEIVRERSFRRGLIRVSGELAQLGWDDEGDPTDKLLRLEDLVDELRHRQRQERDELMTLHAAAEYLDAKFRDPPDETAWVPGPWSFVPRLGPGRLYVLGGYAADGKTACACQFFVAAAGERKQVTFLTLEMSKEDLAERVASTLGLPATTVQTGRIPETMEPVRRRVLERLTELAPYGRIWDAPGADIPTIRSHVKTTRPGLLIVDHLHQFHLRSEYERQDLENVVRGLWRIAREFSLPVLLLAQLSRSGDKRHPFPMPTMSALKGSGAIEQLAWAVWFVYRLRDEANLPTEEASFVVAKNRSGGTGTRRLAFHPREVRYGEIAREG